MNKKELCKRHFVSMLSHFFPVKRYTCIIFYM